ncbi:Hypothetical predicted protein, partial [Pelobates cultripes]
MVTDSARALQWTRQLYYEKSNMADTLLAPKLKCRATHKRIDKIKSPDGQKQDAPQRIADVFQGFFSSLYDHSPQIHQNPNLLTAQINRYLNRYLTSVNQPSLPSKDANKLIIP